VLVVAALGAGIWAGIRYVPPKMKESNAEKMVRQATTDMFQKYKSKDPNLEPVKVKLKTELATLGINDPKIDLITSDPGWLVARVTYDQTLSFPTKVVPVVIEAKTDTKPVKL